MLRTGLLDVINDGTAWAFVGSGVSADAGLPNWRQLVEQVVAALEPSLRSRIEDDNRYKLALDNKDYCKCLGRIEKFTGRALLEDKIAGQLQRVVAKGQIANLLVDWPFAGYITTNYDGVLEDSLQAIDELGWSSVGNTDNEVQKIAGDTKRVVWHLHGSVGLPNYKSRLVLTEEDYEDFYGDEKHAVTQLRGLLALRRVIFIGFGFEDPELKRFLRLTARLCNPARPAFAFLSGLSRNEDEARRQELLENFNVDVIPYSVGEDGSHRNLVDLLAIYNALILRRSQRFGQPARPCPSYDPETTGLLVYNNICLRGNAAVAQDVLNSLLRARILSLLKHKTSVSLQDVVDDLYARASQISAHPSSRKIMDDEIEMALDALVQSGYVEVSQGATDSRLVKFTPSGLKDVSTQASWAERISDQFSASLKARANSVCADSLAARKVVQAVESFLKESIAQRALGVAMVLNAPSMPHQSYHMVALLQELPKFIAQLDNESEAKALVGLITAILGHPSQAESEYLGLLLQAQFAIHLLGYDPDSLRARTREVANTLFLIDSTTLIPFLARSSVGNDSARLLTDRLRSAGASIATTTTLATEVAEHARWPIESRVISNEGYITEQTVWAAEGVAGFRVNAFLDGFLTEVSEGKRPNYLWYLETVCGCRLLENVPDVIFVDALRKYMIEPFEFGGWEGFTTDRWAERDHLQGRIAERRKASKPPTYRHERQVKAEAEALIIIQDIRNGVLTLNGVSPKNAYFVSHTRIIDEIGRVVGGLPITIRPEGVLHWLTTISPCATEELGYLFTNLLWELSERGVTVIDTKRLQTVFSPLISGAKEKLNEELQTHRALISHRYGEDAELAFRQTSDLDAPIVMHNYMVQKTDELEKSLVEETKKRKAAEHRATISDAERSELQELRTKEKQRRKQVAKKNRAVAARRGKKKR